MPTNSNSEKSLEQLLKDADEAEYANRWNPCGANDAWYAVLKLDPTNSVALQRLAMALSEAGCHTEMRDLFEDAVEKNPHSANFWFSLGIAYSNLGDAEKSLECSKQVCNNAPERAYNWKVLVERAQKCGDTHTVNRALTKLHELEPDDPRTIELYGRSLIAQNKLNSACQLFERLVEMEPRNAAAWLCLSQTLEQVDASRASEAKQAALAAEPTVAHWLYLADTYMQDTGNAVVSEIFIRCALDIDPSVWYLHESLSRILQAQGRSEEAAQSKLRAEELRKSL